ncbi:putative RNA recognition motif domain, nucleotide-binding alpha-beta plait domain superfamily [Helianthus annuus]|uniref:Putative RNA recognition motif domain, eukaryote, Nucleotide-binding alpha-beta plait domain protein n=1 Tax=Helianthus annuus TaxID=4232 RepID=A0A251VC70_HELAN|nr:polyadenylate-binding protein 4-like [Helianthus annuus]KAF5816929.1 putative RNA recognition motif domain, nucleotide-binding alpha-beta plait domain superfamily [Helianthus annuus]KAJ0603469.1 putative RNA recognition motif domain, nucleotide-binding alpha-beta plait domain superfamily [Helianthus annuus]KAJ0613548.1 putative RNA recognition motif domain, nucleotide-binding alpha-beta plait domain superfamily [Helianthus annuus]KAJ0617382.1 putative RNA recognition motif domain, nucleotide
MKPASQTTLAPPLLPSLPATSHHRAALYVGDLHPYTTDNDLLQLFSMIGPVSSVRVCRDRFSFKSLGYGYVNFYLPSHADTALARLNHTELRGKPMRIMWCQRDPVTRRTGIANLFVKNLNPFITDVKLEEVFGKFGMILSCKVAKDVHGKSKGFGFVQFDSEESSNNALQTLDGSVLVDKIISVAKFMRKSERKEPEFTNVYVKNLESDFTENQLKDKFSEYGNVTSVVIMKDADGGSRGFGFVNFESPDSAKKAIEALNGAIIGSKELFVGKAMKKAEREGFLKRSHQKDKINALNLFVRNLALSVDEKCLEETFGAFGKVILTKVVRHETGISKGFGFVCFANAEDAKRSCDSLNGKLYHGKHMNVSVAMSKEECTQRSQARFASEKISGPNPYLNFSPYYAMQPYGKAPVYNPYWQPNIYRSMQVFPNFKPVSHQEGVNSSYDKDQKPFKSFKAYFSEGSLAKKYTSYAQNLSGMKSSRVLWEMKKPVLHGPRKAFLKVKNEVVANAGVFG